ncbi:unnamed protein product [Discosporangium mesarthrocarpum]
MPIGVVTGGGGRSPEDLFRSIPPLSKVIIVSMVGMLLSQVMGVFSWHQFAFIWPLVWKKFQFWRIFTAAFFPGLPGFSTLITMYTIGMYSIRYEEDSFSTGGGGGSADYSVLLIFGLVVMETFSVLFLQLPFITSAMLFMIAYVWSRKNANSAVSFFGVAVQAVYVPWVMVGINVLMGMGLTEALLGIGVGHLYYFLIDILPDTHNIDLIQTPGFLVTLFGWGRADSGVQRFAPQGGMAAPGVVPPPRAPGRVGGPSWGPGRTLGVS